MAKINKRLLRADRVTSRVSRKHPSQRAVRRVNDAIKTGKQRSGPPTELMEQQLLAPDPNAELTIITSHLSVTNMRPKPNLRLERATIATGLNEPNGSIVFLAEEMREDFSRPSALIALSAHVAHMRTLHNGAFGTFKVAIQQPIGAAELMQMSLLCEQLLSMGFEESNMTEIRIPLKPANGIIMPAVSFDMPMKVFIAKPPAIESISPLHLATDEHNARVYSHASRSLTPELVEVLTRSASFTAKLALSIFGIDAGAIGEWWRNRHK